MHPEFEKDRSLKSSIGLEYTEENMFKQMKDREVADKMANTIQTMLGLKEPTVNPDGTPGEESIFDAKFVIEKYSPFNDTDLKLNAKYKRERKEELRKLAAAYKRIADLEGGAAGADAGMGGESFGGLGGETGGGFGGETGGMGGLGGLDTGAAPETPAVGAEAGAAPEAGGEAGEIQI